MLLNEGERAARLRADLPYLGLAQTADEIYRRKQKKWLLSGPNM
jgi:hypothetical protein